MKCPIKLDDIHCPNCYFQRQGKCDYDRVIQEQKAQTKYEPAQDKSV